MKLIILKGAINKVLATSLLSWVCKTTGLWNDKDLEKVRKNFCKLIEDAFVVYLWFLKHFWTSSMYFYKLSNRFMLFKASHQYVEIKQYMKEIRNWSTKSFKWDTMARNSFRDQLSSVNEVDLGRMRHRLYEIKD